MPITSDTYQYSKNVPVFNRDDDAQTIRDLASDLGYNTYSYGGMVVQLEPNSYVKTGARFFVSFTELNNGKQVFHEASGGGYVFNAQRDDDAFKHFLVLMQENVDKGKTV